jgi:tetratricopeptide (TPR) repeat protein
LEPAPNGGGEVPSEDLSHVTNPLYKEGIFVQIRWTNCNKTNNFQCCQYYALIRIQTERAMQTFRQALAVAQRLRVPKWAAWALWGIGSTLRATNGVRESPDWFAQAAAVAASGKDRRCEAWSHAEIAEVQRILADHQNALAGHQEVLDEFERLGDFRGISWAYAGIGQILRVQCDLPAAARAFVVAQQTAETCDDVIAAAWALRGQAEVQKESGDLARAEASALAAVASFQAKGYPTGTAYAQKTQADVELLGGYPLAALATIQHAIKTIRHSGESRGLAYCLKCLADVYCVIGEYGQAVKQYRFSRELLRRCGVAEPAAFSPTHGLALLARSGRPFVLVGGQFGHDLGGVDAARKDKEPEMAKPAAGLQSSSGSD